MKPKLTPRLLARAACDRSPQFFHRGVNPPRIPAGRVCSLKNGQQLTVYQPQVDYWYGYTNIHFRCAIALKGVTEREQFGIAEVNAVTVVDQALRSVVMVPLERNLRFPNASDADAAALRSAVDQIDHRTSRPPFRSTRRWHT